MLYRDGAGRTDADELVGVVGDEIWAEDCTACAARAEVAMKGLADESTSIAVLMYLCCDDLAARIESQDESESAQARRESQQVIMRSRDCQFSTSGMLHPSTLISCYFQGSM